MASLAAPGSFNAHYEALKPDLEAMLLSCYVAPGLELAGGVGEVGEGADEGGVDVGGRLGPPVV